MEYKVKVYVKLLDSLTEKFYKLLQAYGDQVLRNSATRVRNRLQRCRSLARYHGDSFLFLRDASVVLQASLRKLEETKKER